ncbi:MAG: hypothetical protein CMJ24_03070 [Phycisphaerae bacterium]|nr:hypothetical protein [Phycisphaerae bacterium]|tara:strand:+ start:15557 stop:16276 length:720 start_codon:yes stop_codon:yes gene_type:complete
MNIIKQDQFDVDGHRLSAVEIENFDRRAQDLIEAAERSAREIIEAARAEAADLVETSREDGRTSGFEAGLQEGRSQGRAEATEAHGARLEQLQAAWVGALEQWQADRDSMFRTAERDVLRLSVKMAELIVHRTVRFDSGVVRSQLESAMGLVRNASDVQVVVGPDDEPIVQELLEELVATTSKCGDASLRVDPDMAPGGCRLELDGGTIDASLETQLHRLAELMLPDETVDQVGDDHDA